MGNYKKYSDELKQEALRVVAAGERDVSQRTCGETTNVEKTRSRATAIKPYQEPFSEMPN